MSGRVVGSSSLDLLPWISCLGCQAGIIGRHTDREVVQALEGVPVQPEHVVHGIIVEAPNPGCARAGGFGFEIEYLSHHARLPEQAAIETTNRKSAGSRRSPRAS